MSKMRQAAQEGTIELLYFDEAGFSCLPNVQRSWSPLGQPHAADASLGRKRVNALGALDYAKGKLHFALCEHNVRREHVIPFFDFLAQSSDPDKFTFLTLDNASIHKNIDPEITRRWQTEHKFFLLYLPPYSPELNLIEILWKHAKYPWRDFTSWTPATLVREVQSILAGFGTKFHIGFA
jgi:hypothetical protein